MRDDGSLQSCLFTATIDHIGSRITDSIPILSAIVFFIHVGCLKTNYLTYVRMTAGHKHVIPFLPVGYKNSRRGHKSTSFSKTVLFYWYTSKLPPTKAQCW